MRCGKGTLESILKVIVLCIESPEKHFAEVIENKEEFLIIARILAEIISWLHKLI